MNQNAAARFGEMKRFWLRVSIGPNCWEWQGARNSGGYGSATIDGKIVSSHRVAWEDANGPIPGGLHVLHKCDNPPCCNPDQLFLGTNRDNIADSSAKDRRRTKRNPVRRLTEDDVIDIRTVHAFGGTQAAIARAYAVSEGCVASIVHERTWR